MATGPLNRMLAGLEDGPDGNGKVRYALSLNGDILELDPLVGKEVSVRFTGVMTCVCCGRSVRKFYGQGFCWPCFSTAAEASECIVRPELCRAHLGEGRDAQWESDHHHQEHVVYLSQTGGIKVGVTRSTQVPVRWIDQGAVMAVVIARTPYRQLAGLIEVELKKSFADRTNYRAMLTQVVPDPDALHFARSRAIAALTYELGAYGLAEEAPRTITFPVIEMPAKIASVNLEKTPEVRGTLAGIKGQYLIWSDGRALNVRNHSGYHVELMSL